MKRASRPTLTWVTKFAVAFRGIYLGVRHERSCWVHLAVTIGIGAAGAIFQISLAEWSILVLCASLVWTAELLNTAIERLSEIVQPNDDERIAAMLDVSAGAVLLASIGAAVIGLIVFLPKFWSLAFST